MLKTIGSPDVSVSGGNKGEVPVSGRNKGNVPVSGRNEGEVPVSGRNKGEVPVSGRNEGEVPVSGKNEGEAPVSGRNEGNVPVSGRNEGDGEVVGFGVGGSGGELPHCWIRPDHPRCRSLERWGSTTMRLLAVVVMVHWNEKSSKFKKPPALEHAFTLLRLAFTNIRIETKFRSSLFSRKMTLRCSIQNSWCRALGVVQVFKIWKPFSRLQAENRVRSSSETLESSTVYRLRWLLSLFQAYPPSWIFQAWSFRYASKPRQA